MRVAVSVDDSRVSDGPVAYRWDVDTDILTAQFETAETGPGMTGSVELEGADGSWVVLDVRNGRVASVEVAVWPDVRISAQLAAPSKVTDGIITFPARGSQRGIAAIEVNTGVVAQADAAERTIHFRFGPARPSRAVRAARDILFELDDGQQIAGIWMLNVPPFPSAS
ncbi:MAG: hypothetical protein O2973_13800 [Gemmatimonadetes bacterium]|nr:hypothetical protein [Gemmatimonadota bacterium]